MLVYGDRSEEADAAATLAALSAELSIIARSPPGIERHASLVGVLIETGRVFQGLCDAGIEAARVSEFLDHLAGCVVRSTDTAYRDIGTVPVAPELREHPIIEMREPEGYAFYALYPETYIAAARKLELLGEPRVIGIRSIGTSLGAIVASTLNAPTPVSVRPFGDPFSREVELPASTVQPGAHYVIVDEGPGLSGSSFGAVADWLEARGVPLERIAFMPSHENGLGNAASERHRRRWRRSQRVSAGLDLSFLEERLGELQPFNGGGAWQRMKFRGRLDGKTVVAKFAGLGDIGKRKFEIARALHSARLVPEPLALIHGFIIEKWIDDGRLLEAGEKPLEQIGRYLGARARLLRSHGQSGASIASLIAMSRRNISLALGEDAEALLDIIDARAPARQLDRVCTDNKMQPEEWIFGGHGQLIKADALDHHRGHDLIGCQAIEWDVVATSQEFSLTPLEEQRLIEAGALEVDQDLLEFYRIAFAAFRLGQCTLAGETERSRAYSSSIKHLLHQFS